MKSFLSALYHRVFLFNFPYLSTGPHQILLPPLRRDCIFSLWYSPIKIICNLISSFSPSFKMTSSYCFCILEYILLITIDPFFHSLSINCIICLFRSSPLFVYTYFIRAPARKEPQRFLYCCTAAGMIQSEREMRTRSDCIYFIGEM